MEIKEKTTKTKYALECAPLELIEFIIQNAQDKEFLLSQKGGKKSRDFLASALRWWQGRYCRTSYQKWRGI